MPATLAAVSSLRDGLADRLGTIAGLRVHDTAPDQLNPPCAVVGWIERLAFDLTFGRSADRYTIPVRLFAGRISERSAQDRLDGWLAAAGDQSVKSAVEADPTLGGAAMTTRVTEARNYGPYQTGEITYLGVEFVMDVVA